MSVWLALLWWYESFCVPKWVENGCVPKWRFRLCSKVILLPSSLIKIIRGRATQTDKLCCKNATKTRSSYTKQVSEISNALQRDLLRWFHSQRWLSESWIAETRTDATPFVPSFIMIHQASGLRPCLAILLSLPFRYLFWHLMEFGITSAHKRCWGCNYAYASDHRSRAPFGCIGFTLFVCAQHYACLSRYSTSKGAVFKTPIGWWLEDIVGGCTAQY